MLQSISKKFPERKDKSLIVGRITAILFGVVALVIALVVPDILQIVIVSTQLILIISPALLIGLLTKRVNEKGAFWSIILGLVVIIPFLFINANIAGVPAIIVAIITVLIYNII